MILLEWRERQGHSIEPTSPIFISESNRNRGQQLKKRAAMQLNTSLERHVGKYSRTNPVI